MRIVFLNPSGQIGGAERSLLDIIASIRTREPGWELALVATADGPLVGAAEGLGVKVTVLYFNGARTATKRRRGCAARSARSEYPKTRLPCVEWRVPRRPSDCRFVARRRC